jgi:hypothetical protein
MGRARHPDWRFEPRWTVFYSDFGQDMLLIIIYAIFLAPGMGPMGEGRLARAKVTVQGKTYARAFERIRRGAAALFGE